MLGDELNKKYDEISASSTNRKCLYINNKFIRTNKQVLPHTKQNHEERKTNKNNVELF